MARATTATPVLPPLNAVPAVAAAQAKVRELARGHAMAEARVQRYFTLLSPSADRSQSVDVLDRLDAARHHVEAQMDVVQLERDLREAQQAEVAARETARADVARAFEPQMRQVIAAFKTALMRARDTNAAVQAVQVARHEATGQPFDSLAWLEFGVRLDEWLAAIQRYGYDE